MLCKEKQIFQAFPPFGSQIQTDHALFYAWSTGLESRRAEWCKPPDDQSTVLQATNQNRPALWCLIAFFRRDWRGWILFWRPPCSGEKGRGAGGKTIVFGILEWQGKVYTEIVPDASKKPLQAVIRGQVALESIIHSDGWRGYNGLVDMGYQKHLRVHP